MKKGVAYNFGRLIGKIAGDGNGKVSLVKIFAIIYSVFLVAYVTLTVLVGDILYFAFLIPLNPFNGTMEFESSYLILQILSVSAPVFGILSAIFYLRCEGRKVILFIYFLLLLIPAVIFILIWAIAISIFFALGSSSKESENEKKSSSTSARSSSSKVENSYCLKFEGRHPINGEETYFVYENNEKVGKLVMDEKKTTGEYFNDYHNLFRGKFVSTSSNIELYDLNKYKTGSISTSSYQVDLGMFTSRMCSDLNEALAYAGSVLCKK